MPDAYSRIRSEIQRMLEDVNMTSDRRKHLIMDVLLSGIEKDKKWEPLDSYLITCHVLGLDMIKERIIELMPEDVVQNNSDPDGTRSISDVTPEEEEKYICIVKDRIFPTILAAELQRHEMRKNKVNSSGYPDEDRELNTGENIISLFPLTDDGLTYSAKRMAEIEEQYRESQEEFQELKDKLRETAKGIIAWWDALLDEMKDIEEGKRVKTKKKADRRGPAGDGAAEQRVYHLCHIKRDWNGTSFSLSTRKVGQTKTKQKPSKIFNPETCSIDFEAFLLYMTSYLREKYGHSAIEQKSRSYAVADRPNIKPSDLQKSIMRKIKNLENPQKIADTQSSIDQDSFLNYPNEAIQLHIKYETAETMNKNSNRNTSYRHEFQNIKVLETSKTANGCHSICIKPIHKSVLKYFSASSGNGDAYCKPIALPTANMLKSSQVNKIISRVCAKSNGENIKAKNVHNYIFEVKSGLNSLQPISEHSEEDISHSINVGHPQSNQSEEIATQGEKYEKNSAKAPAQLKNNDVNNRVTNRHGVKNFRVDISKGEELIEYLTSENTNKIKIHDTKAGNVIDGYRDVKDYLKTLESLEKNKFSKKPVSHRISIQNLMPIISQKRFQKGNDDQPTEDALNLCPPGKNGFKTFRVPSPKICKYIDTKQLMAKNKLFPSFNQLGNDASKNESLYPKLLPKQKIKHFTTSISTSSGEHKKCSKYNSLPVIMSNILQQFILPSGDSKARINSKNPKQGDLPIENTTLSQKAQRRKTSKLASKKNKKCFQQKTRESFSRPKTRNLDPNILKPSGYLKGPCSREETNPGSVVDRMMSLIKNRNLFMLSNKSSQKLADTSQKHLIKSSSNKEDICRRGLLECLERKVQTFSNERQKKINSLLEFHRNNSSGKLHVGQRSMEKPIKCHARSSDNIFVPSQCLKEEAGSKTIHLRKNIQRKQISDSFHLTSKENVSMSSISSGSIVSYGKKKEPSTMSLITQISSQPLERLKSLLQSYPALNTEVRSITQRSTVDSAHESFGKVELDPISEEKTPDDSHREFPEEDSSDLMYVSTTDEDVMEDSGSEIEISNKTESYEKDPAERLSEHTPDRLSNISRENETSKRPSTDLTVEKHSLKHLSEILSNGTAERISRESAKEERLENVSKKASGTMALDKVSEEKNISSQGITERPKKDLTEKRKSGTVSKGEVERLHKSYEGKVDKDKLSKILSEADLIEKRTMSVTRQDAAERPLKKSTEKRTPEKFSKQIEERISKSSAGRTYKEKHREPQTVGRSKSSTNNMDEDGPSELPTERYMTEKRTRRRMMALSSKDTTDRPWKETTETRKADGLSKEDVERLRKLSADKAKKDKLGQSLPEANLKEKHHRKRSISRHGIAERPIQESTDKRKSDTFSKETSERLSRPKISADEAYKDKLSERLTDADVTKKHNKRKTRSVASQITADIPGISETFTKGKGRLSKTLTGEAHKEKLNGPLIEKQFREKPARSITSQGSADRSRKESIERKSGAFSKRMEEISSLNAGNIIDDKRSELSIEADVTEASTEHWAASIYSQGSKDKLKEESPEEIIEESEEEFVELEKLTEDRLSGFSNEIDVSEGSAEERMSQDATDRSEKESTASRKPDTFSEGELLNVSFTEEETEDQKSEHSPDKPVHMTDGKVTEERNIEKTESKLNKEDEKKEMAEDKLLSKHKEFEMPSSGVSEMGDLSSVSKGLELLRTEMISSGEIVNDIKCEACTLRDEIAHLQNYTGESIKRGYDPQKLLNNIKNAQELALKNCQAEITYRDGVSVELEMQRTSTGSVLLNWTPSPKLIRSYVIAYMIYVNGELYHKVRNPCRRQAVLPHVCPNSTIMVVAEAEDGQLIELGRNYSKI